MSRALTGATVRRKRRRKVAYQKRQQNKFSMFLVCLVVLLIMITVAFKSHELGIKIDAKDEEIAQVNEEIAQEEQRREEIDNFKKYTETKGYAEEVAKDKLGLVYEGEIIFKEKD